MKNKTTFIIIIILLLIFIPALIYGIVLKFSIPEEPKIQVAYAKSSLNDLDNKVNTFHKGVKETADPFTVGNKEYAFVNIDDQIYLYSLTDNMKVIDYQAINFYQTDIDHNYMLVKREDKWGILNLDTLKMIVPCEYDYLGLVNHTNNGKLISDAVIVGNDNSYSIYSLDGTFRKISNNFSRLIYDYNISQLLLAVKLDTGYGVYDFEGNRFFESYSIKDIRITDNYIIFIDDTNFLYVLNGLFSQPMPYYLTEEWKTLDVVEQDTKLDIYLDNILYKSIEL